MDFTYEAPEPERLMRGLLALLKSKGEDVLICILEGATCTISPAGSFSGQRWNAMWTEVAFHVRPDALEAISDGMEGSLKEYCDVLIPKEAGLDVMKVSIVPSLDPRLGQKGLEDEVQEVFVALQSGAFDLHLSPDLLAKGREMAEIYSFLYCAENVLRLFIEKVATDRFGTDFMLHLNVPNAVKNGISIRKRNEQTNKWLSVRGDSDLFYVDFKELADIITNNWGIFSTCFPDQAWIRTKIDEMANCRNLIAHNSYVDDHGRDVIRLNFKGIIRQLNAGSKGP
jgi:hypothetical protein